MKRRTKGIRPVNPERAAARQDGVDWVALTHLLLERQRWKCPWCERGFSNDGVRHHTRLKSAGGLNIPDHLAMVHSSCHVALHGNPERAKALGLYGV